MFNNQRAALKQTAPLIKESLHASNSRPQ